MGARLFFVNTWESGQIGTLEIVREIVMVLLRYGETYVDGDWVPIELYISEVGGPIEQLNTTSKQVQWVQSFCKQRVQFDNGVPGVVVPDRDDGRKRIRIGTRTQTEVSEDSCVVSAALPLPLAQTV